MLVLLQPPQAELTSMVKTNLLPFCFNQHQWRGLGPEILSDTTSVWIWNKVLLRITHVAPQIVSLSLLSKSKFSWLASWYLDKLAQCFKMAGLCKEFEFLFKDCSVWLLLTLVCLPPFPARDTQAPLPCWDTCSTTEPGLQLLCCKIPRNLPFL